MRWRSRAPFSFPPGAVLFASCLGQSLVLPLNAPNHSNGVLFCRIAAKGRALRRALLPAQNPAPFPAEHHRLHGRLQVTLCSLGRCTRRLPSTPPCRHAHVRPATGACACWWHGLFVCLFGWRGAAPVRPPWHPMRSGAARLLDGRPVSTVGVPSSVQVRGRGDCQTRCENGHGSLVRPSAQVYRHRRRLVRRGQLWHVTAPATTRPLHECKRVRCTQAGAAAHTIHESRARHSDCDVAGVGVHTPHASCGCGQMLGSRSRPPAASKPIQRFRPAVLGKLGRWLCGSTCRRDMQVMGGAQAAGVLAQATHSRLLRIFSAAQSPRRLRCAVLGRFRSKMSSTS